MLSGGEPTLAGISMFLYVKVYAHSSLWELVAWPTIMGMEFGSDAYLEPSMPIATCQFLVNI